MDHIASFLLLVALLFAVSLITITFMVGRQFGQKSSLWFGLALIGLSCFILEILIDRYGRSMGMPEIIAFSQFWALAGGIVLTLALPRLARQMTGSPHRMPWRLLELALPALTLGLGIAFMLNWVGMLIARVLQLLIFGTAIGSLLFIALVRPKQPGPAHNRFLLRVLVWSALCLPLIIVDALGGILPAIFNDLPMSIFLPGLFLIAMPEVRTLFGRPTYLREGSLSEYFISQFDISNREAEVIALVIKGVNNAQIGESLFISVKTVENHLTSIFRKTGAKNRIQLFRLLNSSSD